MGEMRKNPDGTWALALVGRDAVAQAVKCPECERVFDLLNETDAAEWYYGHDCEEG